MLTIHCVVVTPEKTSLEQDAAFVVVPLFDGEYGVGPGHSPVIGRLGYGELRLKQANGTVQRYYVDGGFVQIADNVVTVLTNRVLAPHELQEAVIREQLASAMKRSVATDELLEQRDRLVEQSRSQLRTLQHSR